MANPFWTQKNAKAMVRLWSGFCSSLPAFRLAARCFLNLAETWPTILLPVNGFGVKSRFFANHPSKIAGQEAKPRMVRICILFLALVGTALGQTSDDLSSKYSQVTAYNVRPHVLMTARFAADGQVCEMTLEKRQKSDSGIVFEDTFSETEVQSLMDDLVPENQRGPNLTRVLNGTVMGGFMTEEYKYENVVMHVDGLTRPVGAAGNRVITITWPKRSCGEAQPVAR